MEDFLLLIRLFLAGVFLIAGVGKLLDPVGSARAVRDFGAPESLAGVLGYALPFAEIVFAICLLFPAYSWTGTAGASILLLGFVGGMIAQIAQGKAPDCHCFGQIHSEPVGKKSLVRNIVLLLAAGFLLVQGRTGQGAAITDAGRDPVFFVLAASAVLLLIVAISYLARILENQTAMDRRVELLEALSAGDIPQERQNAGDPHDGLPIGAVFPDFALGDRDGKPVSLGTLLAERKPLLFFFVGPTCLPCRALMPEIAEWHDEIGSKFHFVIVTSGTAEDNLAKLDLPLGIDVLFQKDRELAEAVNSKWTPTAMFVRADGRVASRLAAGDAAIRDLISRLKAIDPADKLAHVNNGHNGHGKLRIGKPVDGVETSDLNGRLLTSADFIGKKTLAVFWSRTCPHCVTMMEDLQRWDREKGPDEPNLIVFSEGDAAEHRALGLRSTVVLDDGYKTAARLGMQGTPSAILIDENGTIVSETAIGASNIWSLIGRKP